MAAVRWFACDPCLAQTKFLFIGFSAILCRSTDSNLRENRSGQIQVSVALHIGTEGSNSKPCANRSDQTIWQSEKWNERYQISQVVFDHQLDCSVRETCQTYACAQARQRSLREIRREAGHQCSDGALCLGIREFLNTALLLCIVFVCCFTAFQSKRVRKNWCLCTRQTQIVFMTLPNGCDSIIPMLLARRRNEIFSILSGGFTLDTHNKTTTTTT